jgi:hypothetical protein
MSQTRPGKSLGDDNNKLIDASPLGAPPIDLGNSNDLKKNDDDGGAAKMNDLKTTDGEIVNVRNGYPVNLRQLLATKWACNLCEQRFRSKLALKKHKAEKHSY